MKAYNLPFLSAFRGARQAQLSKTPGAPFFSAASLLAGQSKSRSPEKSRRCIFFPATVLMLAASLAGRGANAQAIYGQILGTVTDQTGAAVPGATVTVTDVAKGTSQTLKSNASGNFTFDHLIPDVYTVRSEAANFSPATVENVRVLGDQGQQVNLQMQVSGAAPQTVTVTSVAPPLQTDRAEVGQSLTATQLTSLPNLNRNFTDFELLTPGVQRSSFNIDPTENPQGSAAVSVNGSNYGTLGWLLDGTDNRDPVLGIIVINPTLDSLSDMRVISQNYRAEFGGAVGGVVTAQTKSGSNVMHGDAFWFRRSAALEARNPFTQFQPDPVTGKYIPGTLYSQFGGSLGGPIRKDKAFYFLDYQGTRQRVGTSLVQNVPTMLVRNTCLSGAACNLSQYGHPIYDPGTGVTYPTGIIPAGRLSSQAIALLRQFPAPDTTGLSGGTVNNYTASGNGRDDGDQTDLRLDWQTTQQLHSFGRYDYALYRLNGTPVFGAAGGTGFGVGNTTGSVTVQNQSVAAGFDMAISQTLLTDFRFGFLDYHVVNSKFDAGTAPAAAIGIPNLNNQLPGSDGAPTFNLEDGSISNFGSQNCNCPLLESEQVFQVANNWTKIEGNHSFRFGADLRYAFNLRNASDNNRAGVLSFGNGTTGLGLASLLLGYIDQFQRFDVYNQTAANRQKRGAFYAQDTWRVTPRLTLDYGVRYDVIFPETVNRPDNGGFADLNAGVIRVAGAGPIATNGNAELDPTDLAGRIAIAYQARPTMVIRGGIAQVYDDVGFFGTIFGSVLTHNLPVVNDENNNAGNTQGKYAYTLSTTPAPPSAFPIPANGLIPLSNNDSPQLRPEHLILPKADQWNLSIQQQFTNSLTATIGYVGNIEERIYPGETYGFNVNVPRLPITPAELAGNRDARRPYYQRFSQPYNGSIAVCCNQDITSTAPSARSNYNSLQVQLEQRLSDGLQFQANYTWSRALNYADPYFAIAPRVNYGASDINRNNVFVLNALYELPVGKDKRFLKSANRLENYALGGWQLAGTTTWESGLPFTPTYAECGSDQDIDTNFGSPSTTSNCRPNKVASGPNSGFAIGSGSFNPVTHSVQYFTAVAPLTTNRAISGPFQRPAFGTFGDIGRNSLRGPSDYLADASLFKNFPIRESLQG